MSCAGCYEQCGGCGQGCWNSEEALDPDLPSTKVVIGKQKIMLPAGSTVHDVRITGLRTAVIDYAVGLGPTRTVEVPIVNEN